MSILSKLFGRAAAPAPQTETHNGFRIVPDPQPDGKSWRLAARIERDANGQTQVHHLIRADVLQTHDEAIAASLQKARQVIDEQGDALFR
ncbi:HlyU family transcriptional regulator [Loktanella sp. SALINAS62]|uniref:HlyU family transcriptional regulator n=1 Tax=Loktanella sp. SALINAS62 TaxID=2706124 RepID=UPI001B8CF362|nr:HlyU family transcriptional regulator [Loktanella sp. SALINAS62]MBS1303325.1 hypothetical protein [Loktanella sp. SALINAS62]